MMKFKRWKKMIVMLVVATMFLQSVVVHAEDLSAAPVQTETATDSSAVDGTDDPSLQAPGQAEVTTGDPAPDTSPAPLATGAPAPSIPAVDDVPEAPDTAPAPPTASASTVEDTPEAKVPTPAPTANPTPDTIPAPDAANALELGEGEVNPDGGLDAMTNLVNGEGAPEEVPAEVQAFLDAVAEIPAITSDNVVEVSEYVYGPVSDVYEVLLGTEYEERADVQEAVSTYAAAIAAINVELDIQSQMFAENESLFAKKYTIYDQNFVYELDCKIVKMNIHLDVGETWVDEGYFYVWDKRYGTYKVTSWDDISIWSTNPDVLEISCEKFDDGKLKITYTGRADGDANIKLAFNATTRGTGDSIYNSTDMSGAAAVANCTISGIGVGTGTGDSGNVGGGESGTNPGSYNKVHYVNLPVGATMDFLALYLTYNFGTKRRPDYRLIDVDRVSNYSSNTNVATITGDAVWADSESDYYGYKIVMPEITGVGPGNAEVVCSYYNDQMNVSMEEKFIVTVYEPETVIINEVTGLYFNYDGENVLDDDNPSVGDSNVVTAEWGGDIYGNLLGILVTPNKTGTTRVSGWHYNSRDMGNYDSFTLSCDEWIVKVEDTATYTVKYTDGVTGETIFADRSFEGLKVGDDTPAFDGTLTRAGYIFNGWKLSVNDTNILLTDAQVRAKKILEVDADTNGVITYTAVWELKPDKPTKEAAAVILTNKYTITVKCTNANRKHTLSEKGYGITEADITSIGEVKKVGDKWMVDVYSTNDKFIEKFNEESDVHCTHDTKSGGFSIGLTWNGSEWTYESYTREIETECHPVQVPAPPTKQEVRGEIGAAVKVLCDTENKSNDSFVYTGDSQSDRVTIGEVQGDAVNGYTCNVTFIAQKFCDAYNSLSVIKTHTLAQGQGDVTLVFTWNTRTQAWEKPEGFTGPVTIHVVCETAKTPRIEVRKSNEGFKIDEETGNATVDYTVTIKNVSGFPIYGLRLTDTLTPELTENGNAKGTANATYTFSNWKVNGEDIAPISGEATDMTHVLGLLARNAEFADQQTVTLTYTVEIETNNVPAKVKLDNIAMVDSWSATYQQSAKAKARTVSSTSDLNLYPDDPDIGGSGSSTTGDASIGGSGSSTTEGELPAKYTLTYQWNLPDGAPGKTLPTDTRNSRPANSHFNVDTTNMQGDEVTGSDGKTYVFSGWTVPDGIKQDDKGYVMPAEDVTITGTWTEKVPVITKEDIQKVLLNIKCSNNGKHNSFDYGLYGNYEQDGILHPWYDNWCEKGSVEAVDGVYQCRVTVHARTWGDWWSSYLGRDNESIHKFDETKTGGNDLIVTFTYKNNAWTADVESVTVWIKEHTHIWSRKDDQWVTKPDCITDGTAMFKCECDGEEERTVEGSKLGHDFEKANAADNCTTHTAENCNGHTLTCTRCDGRLTGGIETENHNYGDWTTTKQPTATERGEKERRCTKCGHVEKEEIAALGEVTITIRYVDEDGKKVGDPGEVIVTKGSDYDVTDEIEIPEGYEADGEPENATGTADKNKIVTVHVKKIEYNVTYTDGVDDEEVFTDQIKTVKHGDTTPVFDGTPSREGYIFTGWTPEVADTVTENVIYTAQWDEDKIGNDPENPGNTDFSDGIPDKYQATVTFTAENGTLTGPTKIVVTLKDAEGKEAEDGTAVLEANQIPTAAANEGYGNGTWTPGTPMEGYEITGNTDFVITFTQNSASVVPTPVPPTPADPTPVPPTPEDPTPDAPAPEDPAPEEPAPVVPAPVAAVPAPAPVVTPVQPTPAAPAPAEAEVEPEEQEALEIEDQNLPLASGENEEESELIEIEEEEMPLAEGNGAKWALINFALMNLAIFESLMLLIGYFVKTKDDEDEDEKKLKKKGIFRILSVPVAVISLIAFILTEDITLPTGFVDKYTILMLIIAIVQTVAVALSKKKYEDEEKNA